VPNSFHGRDPCANGQGEMTSKVRQPATGSMFLGFLRTATLVAGLAGAVGSLGLLFHARR
jgi:hypothetical protein